MAEKKNLCAMIPLALHQQVSEAREAAGMTTSEYVEKLLIEYYEMKKNGGKSIMANGTRTMAFQISEELFQRIKRHLGRETARIGKKLTQRDFVLGLIEAALNEAESRQANPDEMDQEDEEAGDAENQTEEAESGTENHADGETGTDRVQNQETDPTEESEQVA